MNIKHSTDHIYDSTKRGRKITLMKWQGATRLSRIEKLRSG
jgi:hypothetical protein